MSCDEYFQNPRHSPSIVPFTSHLWLFLVMHGHCRWHINEHCGGSMSQFIENIRSEGLNYMRSAYVPPSWRGLSYIIGFGVLQAALQVWLPGRKFAGPPTPKGNVPIYTANGMQSYIMTLLILGGLWYADIFDPGKVYDNLGSIISTSNIFSLVFCGVLYLKVI